jgi:hypothetical protein
MGLTGERRRDETRGGDVEKNISSQGEIAARKGNVEGRDDEDGTYQATTL